MPDSEDSDATVDSIELDKDSSSYARNKLNKHHRNVSREKVSKRSPMKLKDFHPISDSEDEEEDGSGDKDLFPSDDDEPTKSEAVKNEQLPKCQYWDKCYRKNPEHRKMFLHPFEGGEKSSQSSKDSPSSKKKKIDASKKIQMNSIDEKISANANSFGFYLTKVHGIPSKFNQLIAYDIKDLLSSLNGKLKASAQFNYMFDIPWLLEQYPVESRKCPLLIVHGEQRESKKALEKSGERYSNIRFCQAKLSIPFGTHHTKMMFLLYENGLKVIIHTSNLVPYDWHQRTQGMWISPLFPPLKSSSESNGESTTNFKTDLLEYIRSYEAKELVEWCDIIKGHDMSSAKVFIIGSSPGRHIGSKRSSYGHLKLRKVLRTVGPSSEQVKKDWYTVGQFSSIGSLGAEPSSWLCGEFSSSLSMTRNSLGSSLPPLKLVFPSVENVRCCLEGYPAGTSLPYSIKVASKQSYLKSFLYQWKSEKVGRSEASPHIKTYMRVSPDHKKIAWFLVTSANLSKAAWGSLEKKETQFMIRSYELGVLFLPEFLDASLFFDISGNKIGSECLTLPYDIPLTEYKQRDEPWIWDIPHVYGPDRFGNMWCPP